MRKDGRSQRVSLANNPPANAADRGLAVHGAHNGRGRAWRQAFAGARESRLPAGGILFDSLG
jgi:hypothetical protein